jgi:hypothetical protein
MHGNHARASLLRIPCLISSLPRVTASQTRREAIPDIG